MLGGIGMWNRNSNPGTRNADISMSVPMAVIVHLGILTCRNASMVVIIHLEGTQLTGTQLE